MSLSSGLVALGFASQASERAFAPFAAAVLPTLFILGWFSIVRLVDNSIENMLALRSIARIRTYYATLTPEAAAYFPSSGSVVVDAQQMAGVRYTRWSTLFTMASMIGMVDAVVGGTIAALLASGLFDLPLAVSIAIAVLVAAALVVAVVRYVDIRFRASLGPETA